MTKAASTVLVTGAFGNLGRRVLAELKARGYRAVAMDLDTPANRKAAAGCAYDEAIWGDIRTLDWAGAASGAGAVIHLAAVLPPYTERNPELARAVNLEATLRLIDTLEAQDKPAQLVFPSSVTVFGYPTSHALRTAGEPTKPSDNYTSHKVAIEERLARSPIPWSVLRVGVSVDGQLHSSSDPEMTRKLFAARADNPVEYVHPADVALAMVNALDNPDALGKIWLIGGGSSCRVTQYDLLSTPLAAMGVNLPREMLGNGEFYTHWMDTAESERVLRFQKHSFDDFRAEIGRNFSRWKWIAQPFAPLILWGLRRSLRKTG
ncbi:MAG: NAD(P)-dependent oxidoreductase [Novosphingobium sp.]|nr:NAD(P)-dependent oxidoreductase [Novosphingobium sp.]